MLVLAIVLTLPATAAAAKGKQPPPRLWGAWIGDQMTGTAPPEDMSAVAQLEHLTGKGLSIIHLSVPFANCSESPCYSIDFPARNMQRVRDYGAIPFLSWSSFASSGAGHEGNFQLSDLIAGTYDAYIAEFAAMAARWGHPFFLRFNWEMNGRWFPWSEGVNGNRPGEYVAAWRHVHGIFSAHGAHNATWVWCPYAQPRNRFRPLKPLYPGHAYVDWTCMDGFNWGPNPVNPQPWTSFDKIFAPTYKKILKHIAPNKPMLLAEMASSGGARAKSAWIRNMFRQLRTKYRRIRGLIWFNQIDRGVQWPLETSAPASQAFRQGIRRGFRPNMYADIAQMPIRAPGRPFRHRRSHQR